MSSIERAMSKLAGQGGAPDEPVVTPRTDQTPATMQPTQPDVMVPDTIEAAASLVEPEPDATPPASATRSEPEPATSPTAKRPSSKTIGHFTGEANFVQIDLDRLAAAGFLVPDQAMTRQSEEFQHIKRRLLGNMVPGILLGELPANLVLITSSVPGEGKTFTSVNLAISIAMEVDHTVLAIDTDIMKRDLSKVFGVVDRPGLFDLLADPRLQLQDLLVRTSIPNLVLLPAGSRREGSTELLASVRMKELAKEISKRYHDRVVLFDSPPVLATTTATALAPVVGQVILVAEAGNTKHETIREALSRLDHVRVTGVILNKSKQQTTPGYDYYGSYYRTR